MHRLTSDHALSAVGPEDEMAVWIAGGETIAVETNDWFLSGRDYARELAGAERGLSINPSTGPIGVVGAEPGDALRVEIINIELAERGLMFTYPGSGVLGGSIEEIGTKVIPLQNGCALFGEGITLPLSPMIGTIGVAPPETVPCYYPGRHGGNMDARPVAAGSVLYLPVFVKGGGVSLGDLHAAMGDGELSGWGIETPGTATLRIGLVKGMAPEWPLVETTTDQYILVSHERTDDAIALAAKYAARLIREKTGLPNRDAISLLSLIGHVEICQVVNPLKTIRLRIAKNALPGLF